jgi:two-component system, NarL family, invasion response regulator UvrY
MDMKIFIADDHAIIRRGIRQLLEEEFSNAEFGEASDGSESVNRILSESWDVIILDVSMPQKNGMDVLRHIRRENVSTPVLVLSLHGDNQYASAALLAGADAYMEKKNITDDLLKTIGSILKK